MQLTISLAFGAFALSFLLTPFLRDLAQRLGWVDKPDNLRKTHVTPVPRIGGVPIVLAYLGSLSLYWLVQVHGGLAGQQPVLLVWKLLPATVLVFVVGLLDDFVGLKPWQKLAAETLAAGLAYLAGIRIESLAGFPIEGLLGVPLTIIWLVGCANAFNLIDGMDGLAGGLGLFATLTTFGAGLLHHDAGLVIATAPLAGALLAFLRFNFNPASIFLGDCGSLWVGFTLACYAVIWSQKSATLLGITAPLMALSIPLLDTALTIARRFLRRQPIFSADRGHIHHRLLDRGLTPRRAVFMLYAASALAACLSLLQGAAADGAGGIVVAAFCGAVCIGIQLLGYKEFAIAARLLRQNNLRSMVKSHFFLLDHEASLRAASSVEECWHVVQTVSREFGFSNVALRLAGRMYQKRLSEAAHGQWMLHIPLSDSEYVRLMCPFELSGSSSVVVPLANLIHRVLSAKAAEFRSDQPALKPGLATVAGLAVQDSSDYVRQVA